MAVLAGREPGEASGNSPPYLWVPLKRSKVNGFFGADPVASRKTCPEE